MWLWPCIVEQLQLTSLLLFDTTLWAAIFRGTSFIWLLFFSCEQCDAG